MKNGKITELRIGQTYQRGVRFIAKGNASATDRRAVEAEIWCVTDTGLSLYPTGKGDQRKDGHTGEFCSLHRQVTTNADQAHKEAIEIPEALDQQSGPYCAGRIFSKEGSCQKRTNKLRYHLATTGCGSKSSRKFTISLSHPILFSLNKLLMN
jgi:hypothetical protein